MQQYARYIIIAIAAIVVLASSAFAKDLNFWSVIYTESSTEGGSSGSALLNSSGQIIGQLTGGNASCQAPLDDPNYYDLYGQFLASWDYGLSDYLDNGKSGQKNETAEAKRIPDRLATRAEDVISPGLTLQLPAKSAHTVVIAEGAIENAQKKFEALAQKNSKRYLTGVHIAVPDFTKDRWEQIDDGKGNTSWRIAIRAPQAKTLRLHFTRFVLDPNDEVIVYADPAAESGRRVEPSRTAMTDDFWGPITKGEVLFLEVVTASKTPPDVAFDKVSYAVRDFSMTPKSSKEGNCYLDPNCFTNEAPFLADLMMGVGQMVFETGGEQAVCTGTMILDEATSFTPYFYTANHCFHSDSAADSLITSFFWFTDQCNGTALPWEQVADYVEGSDILVSAEETDVLLLQLDQYPPEGTLYFSWSISDQPINEPILVLHHPAGTHMRLTIGYINGVSDADDVDLDDDDDDENDDDDSDSNDDGGNNDSNNDDDGCCGC
jgi:hypothetical protein